MGQLRRDRMDRAAAVVRRQCRHDRHWRVSPPSNFMPRGSSRRISRRSSPTIRAAPMASSAASARNIRAACFMPFRYLMDHFSSAAHHRGRARRAAAGQGSDVARGDGRSRLSGCIRTSTTCWSQQGQHMPRYFDVLIDPYDDEETVAEAEAEFRQHHGADLYRRRLVRLHLQDPSRRRAELFQQNPGAEENDADRPGASRPAAARAPRRDAALVRPLAQGHRHRHHEGAAGAAIG